MIRGVWQHRLAAVDVIEDAFVGPFTAIDDNSTLIHSEIEYSIVLAGCSIKNVPSRIDHSLIGRGVVVDRSKRRPQSLRLVLGDNSAVTIP